MEACRVQGRKRLDTILFGTSMSGEQPLQFPEDLTDEEIAAAVVVAVLAKLDAAPRPDRPMPDSRRWIDSGRPGGRPTWKDAA